MSDPLVSTPTACYSQIESSDVADVSILSQALGKSGRRGPQLFENHINHCALTNFLIATEKFSSKSEFTYLVLSFGVYLIQKKMYSG